MPRRLRLCPPGVAQHVIQRGNDRQDCFRSEEDYIAYAHWLREASIRYEVQIHAWVFMTNHTHLLVTPADDEGTSRMMQYLGNRYVSYFNRRHCRTGTLWEGRFRSCLVDSTDYLIRCHRYIEMNPVRAGIVNDPASYKWSSHRSNGYGIASRLRTPHCEYLGLGLSDAERLENYRSLFLADLDREQIDEIRTCLNTGMALGSEGFKRETGKTRTGPRPVVPNKHMPKQRVQRRSRRYSF